jgi:hypothetical protein
MAYKTENKYKVTFNDGTYFKSNGSAESEFKNLSIHEEFKWLSYHISKEVLAFDKQMDDIIKIEYIMSATCY